MRGCSCAVWPELTLAAQVSFAVPASAPLRPCLRLRQRPVCILKLRRTEEKRLRRCCIAVAATNRLPAAHPALSGQAAQLQPRIDQKQTRWPELGWTELQRSEKRRIRIRSENARLRKHPQCSLFLGLGRPRAVAKTSAGDSSNSSWSSIASRLKQFRTRPKSAIREEPTRLIVCAQRDSLITCTRQAGAAAATLPRRTG